MVFRAQVVLLCWILQVDVFEIEAVELLDIRKVIIGHDEIEGGSGLFLDKLAVYAPTEQGIRVSIFECNRLL